MIGGAALAAWGAVALTMSGVQDAPPPGAAVALVDGGAPAAVLVSPPSPLPSNVIPAGTAIVIQIDAPVTSRTATRGDMFPISLSVPVRLNDSDVIPAGIVGEGQVVHAARTGFGGRAGELIVAARYLQWGDRRIALRGMRISTVGKTNTAEALAVSQVIPLGGLFVTGTSVDLPAGQIAVARLTDDVPLEPAAAPPSAPQTTDTQPTEIEQGD